jgi:hypothetical protein
MMNLHAMQLFANVDKLWVKRKRLLDTLTIVKVLHQTAILRRGLGHVLDMTYITPASAAAEARVTFDCMQSDVFVCGSKSWLPLIFQVNHS